MIKKVLRIDNELGLHARAAAKLVKLSSTFKSDIRLSRSKGNQHIDGKSILGVLLLAAARGTELDIFFEGSDEIEAAEAVEALVKDRFGE
ncbi:MAG: HPr family phosphocarrier protein [Acidobacteriota bacterium]